MTEDKVKTAYKNVKLLSIGDGNKTYGEYDNVEFGFLTFVLAKLYSECSQSDKNGETDRRFERNYGSV